MADPTKDIGHVSGKGDDSDLQKKPKSLDEQLANVQTELEFYCLSEEISDHVLDASLEKYQDYLDELDAAREQLDGLLSTTAATLEQLSEISHSFRTIDGQTKVFETQSAGILAEQQRNEQMSEQIRESLQYYEPLERITRRLNAPGAGNFVRSQDFSDMLVTLDECVDYMQTHPKHKEAETYRSRYKLLLTRALTLVRNTFLSGVRETTAEVAKRIADQQLNDTTMSTLLYTKFRVGAAEMKELGLEIQKRANPPADADPTVEGEYQALMDELHTSFAASRGRLIFPLIHKRLAEIGQAPSSKDLEAFAIACIGYIRGMCLDEFELWGEWFHGQRGLYTFLDSICEPLYDALRPRIIHETFAHLCSLVQILQDRYFTVDDDELPNLNDLDFATLLKPVLEDAQSQLVFRAQAIIVKDIERFKPSHADLIWPKEPPSTPLSATRKTAHQISMSRSHSTLEATAYPTLTSAIRLLSSIYRLIHSAVFDDLAHEIVHQTTLSLVSASTQIPSKGLPVDGHLFLLKHLLLLKSQIVAFDIEYVTPEVAFDFSGMTNTFYELRARGGLFNPQAWLKLVGGGLLPRVVENMLDAKVELDGRLRTVINDFIAVEVADMTKALPITATATPGSQANTPGPDVGEVTLARVQREVPLMRAKLEQFIDDARTRETLVAAVLDQVVQSYETYLDGIENGKGTAVSRKGKGKEGEIWDLGTFSERVGSVFNVQMQLDLRDGDDEERDGVNGSESRSRSLSRSGST